MCQKKLDKWGGNCQAESSRHKLHRLVPGKLSSPFVSWLVFKVAGPHFDALVILDTRCRSHRPPNTIRDYKDTRSIVQVNDLFVVYFFPSFFSSFRIIPGEFSTDRHFMEFVARLLYGLRRELSHTFVVFVILIIGILNLNFNITCDRCKFKISYINYVNSYTWNRMSQIRV